MSATTEFILEQIRSTESAIVEAKLAGNKDFIESLEQKLHILRDQFNASSSALNEGKSILKG